MSGSSFATFKFPEPTEQRCRVCYNLYTGTRTRLCENKDCFKWWSMERERDAYKYGPVSMPVGNIFYLDYTYGVKEPTKPEPEEKDSFFANTINELLKDE